MRGPFLIVDDEESIRTSLRGILEDESYTVEEASSGEQALELLCRIPVSAIFLDIWMEGMDGIEALRRIKSEDGERPFDTAVPVIMMSGHGTIDTAVAATKEGAYDFLEKPLDLDRVLLLLDRAICGWELIRENRDLKARMEPSLPVIGNSPAMQTLDQQICRMAPTDGWVLITGENGAGKEVAARRIHDLSKRSQGPFVAVNSAAIPEERIEIELFGREQRGESTASGPQPGRFEQSTGGTLFLDAIGDMSLKTQSKILRVLQERRLERVGGQRQIQLDARVIAASNKDLEEEIANGKFRQDLYYRLNVIPLHIPPLRQRVADIPRLVDHFTRLHGADLPQQRRFSTEVIAILQRFHWPGNVRELRNLVERLLIMAPGPVITPEDLPDFIHKKPAADSPGDDPWQQLLAEKNLREARLSFERLFLKTQLERNQGNISRTSEAVGMERSALHRKLKTLGLG